MDLALNSGPEDIPTSPPPTSRQSSPIDPSEIQGYLNKYQYASEPSYFTRPNRYHGPPSTWRSWTANDRAVAESLGVARANNLSIHLYNAYDLKNRNRSAPNARHHEAKTRSRDRSAPDEGQQVVEQEFIPPEVWTAWPLRGQHVPRTSYQHNSMTDGQGRTQRIMPSAALEVALLSTTLRHARETWEARISESKHLQVGALSHHWKSERDSGKGESKHSVNNEKEQGGLEDPTLIDRDGTPDSEVDLDAADAAMVDENLPEGVQFFSSQAFAMEDNSPSEDETSTTNSEEEHPVFSADDGSAYKIMKPSVRHLLSRLDDLLEGLHKARAAYALKGDSMSSRSRSRSVFSDTDMIEDDRFVRSGSRAAVKKRGRKRKRSPYVSRSEKSQESRSEDQSTVRISEKKHQAYGLRDWSDVLGMATLTGWDIQTVARASERCARLFDQNMTFRTFHQGPIDPKVVSRGEPWFEEEVAYAFHANEDDAHIVSQVSSFKTRSEGRRRIDCVRISSMCPRCQHLKLRCHPPQLMSDIEFTRPVACAACSSIAELVPPCPGIMIRPQSKSLNKTCPYPDCARCDPTKPFAKNYHLQRHLKEVHGHISSPPTSPMTKDYDRVDVATEEQIRPSVTLTCPVMSCPQSTRIFKRSTRLYDHIRKTHPEFDIASLKKIVAKHSDRGRYDRSRSHSKSHAPVQDDENFVGPFGKDVGHGEDEAKQTESSENGILREQNDPK